MDHDLLLKNAISTVKLAKLYSVPVVHSTIQVASGRQGRRFRTGGAARGRPAVDRTTMNSWEDPDFLHAVASDRPAQADLLRALDRDLPWRSPRSTHSVTATTSTPSSTRSAGPVEAHRAALERVAQAGGNAHQLGLARRRAQRDWGREETVPEMVQIVLTERLLKEKSAVTTNGRKTRGKSVARPPPTPGAGVSSEGRSGDGAPDRRPAGLPSAGMDGRAASARCVRNPDLPGRRVSSFPSVRTRTIVSRIEQHFGGHLPSPADLLAADPQVLRASGMSARKGASCGRSRNAIVDGRLSEAALSHMTDDEVEAALDRGAGIGPWTAARLPARRPRSARRLPRRPRAPARRATGIRLRPPSNRTGDETNWRSDGDRTGASPCPTCSRPNTRCQRNELSRSQPRGNHRRRPHRVGDGTERASEAGRHVVVSNSRGPESLGSVVSELGEEHLQETVSQASAAGIVVLAVLGPGCGCGPGTRMERVRSSSMRPTTLIPETSTGDLERAHRRPRCPCHAWSRPRTHSAPRYSPPIRTRRRPARDLLQADDDDAKAEVIALFEGAGFFVSTWRLIEGGKMQAAPRSACPASTSSGWDPADVGGHRRIVTESMVSPGLLSIAH